MINMANRETHALIGGLTASIIYALHLKTHEVEIDPWELFGVGLCGGIAGILPDILEPATNPNHRSIVHSITTCTIFYETNKFIQLSDNVTVKQKAFAKSMYGAYGSQLLLDGTTPKGLPLLTNGGAK